MHRSGIEIERAKNQRDAKLRFGQGRAAIRGEMG
jgi:hypothetical protein